MPRDRGIRKRAEPKVKAVDFPNEFEVLETFLRTPYRTEQDVEAIARVMFGELSPFKGLPEYEKYLEGKHERQGSDFSKSVS